MFLSIDMALSNLVAGVFVLMVYLPRSQSMYSKTGDVRKRQLRLPRLRRNCRQHRGYPVHESDEPEFLESQVVAT